ncbi:beta-galactosidase [Microbacterium sp. 22303]|uniref:beta-galactosidase n=1 Tax=Microbacterium sp. 22303 TaxID=3453905 RepID=UPI003F877D9D
MSAVPPLPPEVLFGVAYYPEYHQSERVTEDLDLMAAAGINVIRVGESVWSTWEPRNGEFDLEWLAPVLDAAHARGISVILGTPTYAVPPWLQITYPDIAGERRTGEKIAWGARQEVDYSHAAFRFHAERVIRKIIARYAEHPAVIGYQVDNEPGLELLHNHGVFTGFVQSLKDRFGDVETINREWGLTYWSHRLSDWGELWRPDGNTFPQYDLAWRRYQAEVTSDFIEWQADIVREYSREDQFVTTCLQYPRRGLDDRDLFERLDYTSGNPYYGFQRHLDAGEDHDALNYWTTSGVPGLFRQADRLYSSKQDRFLVTETNAQAIDASENNHPPYPGQLRQAAFALISRGAAMIEYWHWHTLPYGTETYWGGVLPHSLVPGRVYGEVSDIGAQLRSIGADLQGYVPDADAAILWSNPSRYAMQFMPPFARGGVADDQGYERLFDAFYGSLAAVGAQARILHVEQALALGAEELVERFPVLIAAGVYVTTDEDIALFRAYVAAGGHLVLGPRTAYADEEARARVATAPAGLSDIAGVWYEEYTNLDAPVTVTAEEGDLGAGRLWADGLIPTGADVVAGYDDRGLERFAAITSHPAGAGHVTVVGTVPNRALARRLGETVIGTPRSILRTVPDEVTVASGSTAEHRFWFIFNWGWEPQRIELTADVVDAVTREALPAGHVLTLAAWDVWVLRAPKKTEE